MLTIPKGFLKSHTDRLFAVLLSRDVEEFRKFSMQYGGLVDDSTPRIVVESEMHRAVTGLWTLPMQMRYESKSWILKHGGDPLDGGEVPVSDEVAELIGLYAAEAWGRGP